MRSLSVFAFLSAVPSAVWAATYQVEVAPGGVLVFSPETVVAQVDDEVVFTFNPKAHSVTQSNFDAPCVNNGGFDTDLTPVAADAAERPTATYRVSETTPLWFYCKQQGHCGQGMVFAINPPSEGAERSFSAFKQLAIQQNGTATSSDSSSSAAETTTFSTPPEPHWESATATVTSSDSTWVTTYTSYDGTPAPTYAATGPQNYIIKVGGEAGNIYDPANITGVAIGDTITFEFYPKNHTVTQSTFPNPCQRKDGGFASGFRPVTPDQATVDTFVITVNDTAPIWGYCGQAQHCPSDGMVFSINAVENGPNNFAAFQALAKSGGSTSGGGSNNSDSGSGSGSGSNSDNADSSGSSDDNGAIALNMGSIISMLPVFLAGFALV